MANPPSTLAHHHACAELLLVTGYAGIGKSVLVQEIHKPITAKRGHFISGKFDQLKRNVPYSALIHAFRDLMRQLLTESEEQLAIWKDRLVKAVGPNGQIVIEVIPDVERIIGPQSEVPELSAQQAQNRFNYVFQHFGWACATPEHPLVLFLDDLQWADASSLHLLELFMTDPDMQALLMIGAYRDNEVNDAHPLVFALNTLRQAGVPVQTMTLTPLALEAVNQLLADTFHVELASCLPLAGLVCQKTGGNPFFARQFLQTLYTEGLLNPEPSSGKWRWDEAAIHRREMTDNVLELMSQKIHALPAATQQALQAAACVGDQFDLRTLAIVREQSPADTLRDLWDALQEELITPLDDSYKYLLGEGQTVDPIFRFLHDRIKQAVYEMIPEAQKQMIHLNIGRLLLANTPEDEHEEQLFEIVNHLNIGKHLLNEPAEQSRILRLNLQAAQKAKASAAYHAALIYAQHGIELVPGDCWQREYDLTLRLYLCGSRRKCLFERRFRRDGTPESDRAATRPNDSGSGEPL